MRKIILVTGGQNSGKSAHAEQLALEMARQAASARVSTGGPAGVSTDASTDASNRASDCGPIYVATAREAGMEERVRRHRARRGAEWTTVEEPLRLGELDFEGRVVLVDCVTLWLTNLFFELGEDAWAANKFAEREFDRLVSRDAVYVFVTNEIGLGGVGADPVTRAFTDLQGAINQYIAARADEVTMVVSGIPVKIK